MLENDDLFQTFFKHLFSLYSSYSQTEEGLSILGKKRSLFPEVYLYHRIKELYSYSENNIVRRDCYVVINDWNTRRDRSREEGQKIDIGAWDPDKETGQCYECKVKFYIKEKVHQLKFLEDIRDHSLGKIHVFSPVNGRVYLQGTLAGVPSLLYRILLCIYSIDRSLYPGPMRQYLSSALLPLTCHALYSSH